MNVLKAINASFTKFWRWIKETAWVQPLLIVGGIFAIIFSISKFGSWFGTLATGSNNSYFTSYRASLENEGKSGINTEADKLTSAINKYTFQEDFASYEEAIAALNSAGVTSTYGEKFYFLFVETDCEGCKNAQRAFEVLQDNWNLSGWRIEDGKSFKMHAIFADEKSSNDKDYTVEDDKKAFYRYALRFYNENFWAEAAGALYSAPYRENANVLEDKYDKLENADPKEWDTPTIFLVDWTKAAWDDGRFGLSEVLFGFTQGSTDYARATLLQQMWNHAPQDAESKDTTNPFRAEYQA